MRMTRLAIGLALAAGGALSGCAPEERKASAPSPQLNEGTAWWKTEGTGAAEKVAKAPALPGWKALPPLSAEMASRGGKLFQEKGCASCHSFGKGAIAGPDLAGLTGRAEPEWVSAMIATPSKMLQSDPRAKELLAKYLVKMPDANLNAEEVRALVEHIRQQNEATSP